MGILLVANKLKNKQQTLSQKKSNKLEASQNNTIYKE
jgi:hypothetical protein